MPLRIFADAGKEAEFPRELSTPIQYTVEAYQTFEKVAENGWKREDAQSRIIHPAVTTPSSVVAQAGGD